MLRLDNMRSFPSHGQQIQAPREYTRDAVCRVLTNTQADREAGRCKICRELSWPLVYASGHEKTLAWVYSVRPMTIRTLVPGN